LPRDEFRAQLELGLGRVEFMNKHWAEAEKRYARVIDRYPNSKAAAEALYWRGVSRYKATHDHLVLGQVGEEFKEKYQDSIWALKAIPWQE
jgi:TolA-binding protein